MRDHEVSSDRAARGMSFERAIAMRFVLVAPKRFENLRFVDLGDGNWFPRTETKLAIDNSVMRARPILSVGKAKCGFEGGWI